MILRRRIGRPRFQYDDTFEEFDRLQRQFDLLTGRLSEGITREPSAGVFPLMNVTEDGDAEMLDMAGDSSSDLVTVTVKDDVEVFPVESVAVSVLVTDVEPKEYDP